MGSGPFLGDGIAVEGRPAEGCGVHGASRVVPLPALNLANPLAEADVA